MLNKICKTRVQEVQKKFYPVASVQESLKNTLSLYSDEMSLDYCEN